MSTWIYGSDPRGQITSARKRLDAASGAPFAPGWDASYAYDDLGNRVTWGQGSAQQTDLSDLEPTSYSRNALHQYTAITGVNASRVTGQAPAAQEVKINGVTTERAGHFYHRRVQDGARSDLTLPHWLEVTVTATTTLPNAQTVTAQRSGTLWQPPIPEEPVYDFDGNLIEDGRWLYTWDAENRLIQMLTRPAAVAAGAPNWRLSFAYDHQSRRIQKKVEVLNGAVWEMRSDARFIYDGWNVVAEVELNGAAWYAPGGTSAMTPRPAYVRRSWVWGEDLSGTLDGAGGVGGLLVVTRHARGGQGRESYWAMSDLNGNVTGLVSTTSGRMAVYEYDAFGRLLRENEPEPGLNPVRFSSKYQDVETGLVYYGFRYYSPETGRWLSRDPAEEDGGLNLYGMVGNDPVNRYDVLGLTCGTHLNKDEAKALACAINFWLIDAGVANALFFWGDSDRSMTLKMLSHYMSKSGSALTVPSSVLMGDSGIQAANLDAKAHFANNSSAPFIRRRIRTSGDLATAVGRTTAQYTLGANYIPAMPGTMRVMLPGTSYPVINGELLRERYTFSDTQPGENVNVMFPFLGLEGYVCCWKCGDTVSDHWMADLEKFGHAKSYDVKGSWSFSR